MKKILSILSFICIQTIVNAQSVTPEVIASSGTTFTSPSARLEFTIGETVTSTLNTGGNTLTQGFHQPELHFASLEDFDSDFVFNLYPNPTQQFVTISSNKEEDMQVHVYDNNGKTILSSVIFKTQTTIDLQALAAANYVLHITTKEGKPLHSYTIIKTSAY